MSLIDKKNFIVKISCFDKKSFSDKTQVQLQIFTLQPLEQCSHSLYELFFTNQEFIFLFPSKFKIQKINSFYSKVESTLNAL